MLALQGLVGARDSEAAEGVAAAEGGREGGVRLSRERAGSLSLRKDALDLLVLLLQQAGRSSWVLRERGRRKGLRRRGRKSKVPLEWARGELLQAERTG